ncbi:MAG TPA: hypothetical protein VFS36_00120 [Chitinophagaceae bacterium]|nr:hypothetical protein [Chitinophagaceae bacterium]
MKKNRLSRSLVIVLLLLSFISGNTQQTEPDTVKTGIYITSIHDIDFKQKEYTVSFWLWLKYQNRDFDFYNNLEVPQAKTVTKSFVTVDSSDGRVYMMMKLQCVMKDSWRIGNFPFDRQKLRLSIENSQYDAKSLVFVPDTIGQHFDPRFTLSGWNIDSCIVSTGIKAYETAFGDRTVDKPHSEYSSYKVRLDIKRDASGLFWKMFLGMYIAFLIAYTCFYIHADGIDSRFGLSVGSLFAVIGNKYIIDSALPESSSFTLVDTLHGLTLFFIFTVIAATAWSLMLVKNNKSAQARRFDMIAAQVILLLYLALNIWFITRASAT